MYITGSRVSGRAEPLVSFDNEHRTGFSFCIALLGFTLVLGQYFLTSFRDDNAYAVPFYGGST